MTHTSCPCIKSINIVPTAILCCIACWEKHDDVIKWKHFPLYWPFVLGIHRSPVNFPHKGQWCRALVFSLICARINGWTSYHEAGDLGCHRAHYDVAVMRIYSLLHKREHDLDLPRIVLVIPSLFQMGWLLTTIKQQEKYQTCMWFGMFKPGLP